MQETIRFLDFCDNKQKRSRTVSLSDKLSRLKPLPTPPTMEKKKRVAAKFIYAKALNFSEQKYKDFPKWLTEKPGFTEFMYSNYERKLLSIPHICEQTERASDEKYLVGLFLAQVPFFQSMPPVILDLLLSRMSTRYFRAGEVLHEQGQQTLFTGVIFIGSVQEGDHVKYKKDVILSGALYGRKHPTIIARQETILLAIQKDLYPEIQALLTQQIQTKERDDISDLLKSTFFNQLHMKDKKIKQFYAAMKVQFYFAEQVICSAGEEAARFYMILKGAVIEENHIYIREHNKWPTLNRKWEVRAVYKSHSKNRNLSQFDFFGDEEILGGLKLKSKYIAATPTVLLAMPAATFQSILSIQDVKRLRKFRSEHIVINYAEFEKGVRQKANEGLKCKEIVRKAIDTSFKNKVNFTSRRMSLVDSFETHMLENANELLT